MKLGSQSRAGNGKIKCNKWAKSDNRLTHKEYLFKFTYTTIIQYIIKVRTSNLAWEVIEKVFEKWVWSCPLIGLICLLH